MYITLVVCGLAILFQHYIRDRIIKTDKLEFSGQLLIYEKSVSCLITASLIHGSLSHEINNLIFIFVIMYHSEMYLELSKFWIIIVYILSGIIGWLISLLNNYVKYGRMGIWNSGVGLSPNMYGYSLFISIIFPNVIFPHRILGFKPIEWILIILIIPDYFNKNKKHNLNTWSIISCGYLVIYSLFYSYFNFNVYSSTFLCIYLLKSIQAKVYWVLYLKQRSGTDHASHFGGAFGGVILGLIYASLYSNKNFIQNVYISLTDPMIFVTFCLLFFRMYFNF